MSATVIVVEVVGITAAAVGVVLAQAAPVDLRSWWARHDWVWRILVPGSGSARAGLDILPGHEAAPSPGRDPDR